MPLPDRQVGYNALISRYGLFCVEDRTSTFIAKLSSNTGNFPTRMYL